MLLKLRFWQRYMFNYKRKVFKWEMAGIAWIIVVGLLWHSLYEWSGKILIIGAIAPVNESIWEHLKLGYWALLSFSIIEYPKIRRYINGFFLSKALGLMTLESVIVIIIYTYTSITNENILWIDIALYIFAAILCQVVSYNVLKKNVTRKANTIGLVIFIIFGIMLVVFTFYPPHLPIFRDSITGGYGIE